MAARLASQAARSSVADRPAVGEARVAHHDVEPAEGASGLVDQPACGVGLARSPSTTSALPPAPRTTLSDLVGARPVLAGMQRDGGIGGGERTSGGGADARRGTGNENGTGHVGSGWWQQTQSLLPAGSRK